MHEVILVDVELRISDFPQNSPKYILNNLTNLRILLLVGAKISEFSDLPD